MEELTNIETKDFEKILCDDMIRYGHIVSDKEFTIDGDNVRQYIVIYDGCKFEITIRLT